MSPLLAWYGYFFLGAAFSVAAFFAAGFLGSVFFDVAAMVAVLPCSCGKALQLSQDIKLRKITVKGKEEMYAMSVYNVSRT